MAGFAGSLAAQDGGAAKAKPEASLRDPPSSLDGSAHGDAREFHAATVGDRIECTLVMAEPLEKGMFTCVELFVDCDDKPATGLQGDELRIRAAVGSRFQPSSAPPVAGMRKPLEHARVSHTNLDSDGKGGQRWLHRDTTFEKPVVEAARLRFWFPAKLVRDRADRYHQTCSIRVLVTTSSSDQPLERQHACVDQGMEIRVDGETDDWSAIAATDPGDELHAAARCVDLTSLRVDHGAEHLFVVAELATAGFGTFPQDADVVGFPEITFLVEPLFPHYQPFLEARVRGGRTEYEHQEPALGTWRSRAGARTVEAAFPRRPGQNRFRVLVHSELRWEDEFQDRLRLDAGRK
jgi:hypothetical protein